jgi:sensor histidine kinase YesM
MQTAAGVTVAAQTIATERPDLAGQFNWTAEWLAAYPLELTRLVDWELMAAAAIVGIAHALFYYRETQKRAIREAQLETSLVEARLQALQHQLHPHFLFNTLHAVSALMHRDVDAADRMLVKLSDLLRLTLDSTTRTEQPLSEEMAFAEKYLEIEQVRLGARLEVVFDVDPDALDVLVPALILQPLVENAVKHGIAPYGRTGRIEITARRDGDMLALTVEDTGSGPSDQQMSVLSTGIGVANTRARLEHQFGSDFRFQLRRHDRGFMVMVAIPWRPVPAGAAADVA